MNANAAESSGEWIDDPTHGYVYKYTNGDVYCGEWKDGKRHGQGFCEYANGNKYIGGWKDDRMHGEGTCNSSDGDEYCRRMERWQTSRSEALSHLSMETSTLDGGRMVLGKVNTNEKSSTGK
jgi:hypothetical protein